MTTFVPRSDDTIAAVASAPGGALRGIVRVSGPQLLSCLARCFSPDDTQSLAAIRHPSVIAGRMTLPGFHRPVDCDLYFWPDQRSYTRQPTAEIHTIGSPPIVEAVLTAVCAAGARPARPGEFTLRAFLAGRLDLTQAEAVLGVIDAAGNRELQTALAQLAGGLATPLHQLRSDLLDLLAHLEAGLDFVEEDIEFISAADLDAQLAKSVEGVSQLLARMSSRAEVAHAPRVVLVGLPNVGKSSLFNALVAGRGRESFSTENRPHAAGLLEKESRPLHASPAIVSPIAGTTRDYLTATVDLGGLACQVTDTAGVAQLLGTDLSIDSAAQATTAQQHEQADVQLLCLDAGRPLDPWEVTELARESNAPRLIVWTKVDLANEHATPRGQDSFSGCIAASGRSSLEKDSRPQIATSSTTGKGLDVLRTKLRELLIASHHADSDVVAGTAVRCRESLRLAEECLQRARELAVAGRGEELVAAEIRVALDALGQVVGAVYTDDILDRIFSRFCIGK